MALGSPSGMYAGFLCLANALSLAAARRDATFFSIFPRAVPGAVALGRWEILGVYQL